MVGMSEADARDAGLSFATATYPFDDHGKSMVMGETHGFVKMIAGNNEHILIPSGMVQVLINCISGSLIFV